VLDAFDLEQAWVLGHSWGGHLALHLLVAHPERLLGVVAVDPLGAYAEAFQDLADDVRRRLSARETAEMEAIEERRRQGHVTEEDLVERFRLVWPSFFADQEKALPPPERVGVEASIEGNRSLADHFERRTLLDDLPGASLPVLFVHGELSAFPARWTFATADLIRGAEVVVVPDAGHFPWVERPGSVRRAVERFLAR
jgi:pimeloyl-ACP methyl ester carboxylesterase